MRALNYLADGLWRNRLCAVGILIALAVAVAAFACAVDRAQAAGPPPQGWYGTFARPSVVCDTKEQLVEIFEAGVAQPDGGAKAKFGEYYIQINARGEHICAITNIGPVAVGESFHLGLYHHSLEKRFEAWAVNIGNSTAGYWLLYLGDLNEA